MLLIITIMALSSESIITYIFSLELLSVDIECKLGMQK